MNRYRAKSEQRSRRRHLLGVERLQPRHLLSAEGFDFSLHYEFRFEPQGLSVEVSRQSSQLRDDPFRGGSPGSPVMSGRPAEGERIQGLADQVQSQPIHQASNANPRIVVILTLPVLSIRPPAPSIVTSNPLPKAAGDSPVMSAGDRSSAAVLATPAPHGVSEPDQDRLKLAAQASDLLQLVSVTPPETPTAAAADRAVVDIASPRAIRAIPAVEARSDQDVRTFDQAQLDSWIQQGQSIEHELAALESLLDDLAEEQAAASRPGPVRAGHRDDGQSNQVVVDAQRAATTGPGEAMILLLPGASMASHWSEIVTRVCDDLDDATISQWTTGIGCFRALDFADEADFAAAVIVDSTLDHGPNLSESNVASVTQSVPLWQQRVFGVLVCCAGIHYLRNRRRV